MIGIITLPNPTYYNYGGVLQNYALTSYVKTLGDTEAIHCDAHSIQGAAKVYLFHKLGILINTSQKSIKLVSHRQRIRNKRFQKFIREEICPRTFSFYGKQTYQKISSIYDKIVVGSDQVWNPYIAIGDRGAQTYFLQFISAPNRISYAASFGIDEIPTQYISLFKKALTDFTFISVREQKAAEIVKQLTDRDVPVVIDPVFLLSSREWEALALKSNSETPSRYIFKYFLGDCSIEYNQKIAQFAERNNCIIVDILNEKDKTSDSGPLEFLKLLFLAEFICTDSYHATAFSIIFKKRFAVFHRIRKDQQNMWTRIESLLNIFQLQNYKDHSYAMKYPIIYGKNIDEILGRKREEACAFLRNALSQNG